MDKLSDNEIKLIIEALGYGVMFSRQEDQTSEFVLLKLKLESIQRKKEALGQRFTMDESNAAEVWRYKYNDLKALIDTPELEDFLKGVQIEAAHQVERWGKTQEETNPPHHYVLVANKLLGKLSVSIFDQNTDKFKHHCITLAAAMFNAHRQIKIKTSRISEWFTKP